MVITKKLLIVVLILLSLAVGFWLTGDNNSSSLKTIKPRPVAEAGIKIIAFGDSLTAGYGLPVAESYPAQLETLLKAKGYQVTVINAGVSGETSKGNLERANFIRTQQPDIVLLGIGGNDALRRLPLSETKSNIAATIEVLLAGDKPPVVALLEMQAPLTSGLSYKQDFDALYSELSKTYQIPLIPFLTAEVFLDNSKKISDGIHFNKAGYEFISQEYILPVMTEILDRMKG